MFLAITGAAIVAVLVVVGLGPRFHMNWLSPRIDPRRRARDDNYFFDNCRSGLLSRYRWFSRRIPSAPRCKFCLAPFGGLGRLGGIKPSRKNPSFCQGCFEMAPLGGVTMDVGVLFADIRGSTTWSEERTPEAVAEGLNRFYASASEVLTARDGLIDKLIGDEVMGLFLSVFPSLGDNTCSVMVDAARTLLERLEPGVPGGDGLPVGIGVTFGQARVGNVGAGEVKDFTAVGDTVNTAARLQASAQSGEVLMSEAVYERVAHRFPQAERRTLTLKGKSELVVAYSLARSHQVPAHG